MKDEESESTDARTGEQSLHTPLDFGSTTAEVEIDTGIGTNAGRGQLSNSL